MRKVTTVRQMRRLALGWRRRGAEVGFVPTMGYLHAGHMTLMKRARILVGPRGIVVVSIYVNPTQFAPTEDLAKYPRDLVRDTRLCREAGVDFIFFPSDTEMYPRWGEAADEPALARQSAATAAREDARPTSEGFSTYVVEEQLSQGMEGAARPAHFRGVTTVVAKLFNIVLPSVAVFGAKDWQQAAVVRRMVLDLNFPVRIVVAPTHREPDGLAMSSRNKYLTPGQRTEATILFRAINEAKAAVARGPQSAAKLKRRLARLIATQPEARLDYVEFFDGATLQPVKTVKRSAHLALAVFVGKTRLIDNAKL